MIVMVSDTSVLIDLNRGGLLEAIFSCDLTLVVPDFLYEQELRLHDGPLLRQLGLSVVALSSDELEFAQMLRNERPTLSLPDCVALSCARRPNHILLTGDAKLRNEAKERECVVHGLLWLLDQMDESGQVASSSLYEGLMRITSDDRCRLPSREVRFRLKKWEPGESS